MLTVTSRTEGVPLVMANLLTSTTGEEPRIYARELDGCVGVSTDGNDFVFSTKPGSVYEYSDILTDALACTVQSSRRFFVLCTIIKVADEIIFKSEKPVTLEFSTDFLKYYHCMEGKVSIRRSSKPESIIVNGEKTSDFVYDSERKAVILTLPAGEGTVNF